MRAPDKTIAFVSFTGLPLFYYRPVWAQWLCQGGYVRFIPTEHRQIGKSLSTLKLQSAANCVLPSLQKPGVADAKQPSLQFSVFGTVFWQVFYNLMLGCHSRPDSLLSMAPVIARGIRSAVF